MPAPCTLSSNGRLASRCTGRASCTLSSNGRLASASIAATSCCWDLVTSQQQDVAAIDAEANRPFELKVHDARPVHLEANRPFELKVHGAGIVAWSYRNW